MAKVIVLLTFNPNELTLICTFQVPKVPFGLWVHYKCFCRSKVFLSFVHVTAAQTKPKERTQINKCLILHDLPVLIPTGVERKPGSRPSFFPHPVAVHDDFPAVPLERMHPVLCPHVGGVSLRLLGPQREPDGESLIL